MHEGYGLTAFRIFVINYHSVLAVVGKMLLFVLNSVLCLLSFLTTATPELTCTNLNIGTSIPPFSGR